MKRKLLYKEHSDKIGLDFLSNIEMTKGFGLAEYEKNGITFPTYTIIGTDINRVDIISLKVYGRTDYWWMLMRVNNILDPFNDLYIGQVLKTPPINMIEDFYNKAKTATKR
jgi:hypothetical protein